MTTENEATVIQPAGRPLSPAKRTGRTARSGHRRPSMGLEQVYKVSETHTPIVIVDFKVAVHAILGNIKSALERVQQCQSVMVKPPDMATWLRCAWAMRLNRGIDMMPRRAGGYQVIVVDDKRHPEKGYWRTALAEQYKSNRSTHTEELPEGETDWFHVVCNAGYAYIGDNSIPFYRAESFEADDWAGMCHRIKIELDKADAEFAKRELFLWTNDGDWMQLVSSEHKILWANVLQWVPRLRGNVEVAEYCRTKWGHAIASPQDIAEVKTKIGDGGDGLPEIGHAIELFDLTKPHSVYNIDKLELGGFKQYELLKADMASGLVTTNELHYSQARQWLMHYSLPTTLLG